MSRLPVSVTGSRGTTRPSQSRARERGAFERGLDRAPSALIAELTGIDG